MRKKEGSLARKLKLALPRRAIMADLLEHLELPQCTCLNASSDHPIRHCLDAEHKNDNSSFLESDADEELLIHLTFMQAVKISHIHIAGVDEATAPSGMKLFVNKVGLDFDSAKSDKPTQEFDFTAAQVEMTAKPTELRYV